MSKLPGDMVWDSGELKVVLESLIGGRTVEEDLLGSDNLCLGETGVLILGLGGYGVETGSWLLDLAGK